MVVGEADDAGAQANVAGAFGGGGYENFRRSYGFPACRVVLADVSFVKPQHVQPLEQFQVAFQRKGWILAHPMEGRHEDTKLHALGIAVFRACHVLVLPRVASGGLWH